MLVKKCKYFTAGHFHCSTLVPLRAPPPTLEKWHYWIYGSGASGLGSAPDPAEGPYNQTPPPDTLAGFMGAYF